MDYAAHATAAAPAIADPRTTYPPPYGYSYPYLAYHHPDPSASASASAAPAPAFAPQPYYYYSDPAAQASAGAQHNPYHYYGAQVTAAGGGPAEYYFGAGDASQAPAVTAAQAAPTEAAAREAVKHFGFDPQRYAQASAGVQHNPYHYYGSQATAGGGGLADYYFGAGEASQAPSVTAAQAAPTEAAREGKHFGFDPQRYAQVAAAKAPNGVAPAGAATVMHHAQWNAHFGHPLPNARRKFTKKTPRTVAQPSTCEVCKIQCDTLEVLMIHKTGQKHKKNLKKLQDAITPQPAKPPNSDAGASTAPAAASAVGVMPAVQPKKHKISKPTPEDLEVKKRRVLEAGAAQGEVKICTACNVVVNSQKVYDFHLTGQKHKAMVQKQQQAQAQLLHAA